MNKEKLIALYNTLNLIDTKGESTKRMADCLKFIEEAIKEFDDKNKSETAGK